MDPFSQLRDELLLLTFMFLPLQTTLCLRAVCQRFKKVVELRCQSVTALTLVFSRRERYNAVEYNDAPIPDPMHILLMNKYNYSASITWLPQIFLNTKYLTIDFVASRNSFFSPLTLLQSWPKDKLTTLKLSSMVLDHWPYTEILKNQETFAIISKFPNITSFSCGKFCLSISTLPVTPEVALVLGRCTHLVLPSLSPNLIKCFSPKLTSLYVLWGASIRNWPLVLASLKELPNRANMTQLHIDHNPNGVGADFLVDFPGLTHVTLGRINNFCGVSFFNPTVRKLFHDFFYRLKSFVGMM